jgi:inosine-uridine nucleoside N-ribohydrolase
MSHDKPKLVIVDTDPGVDDAMAILFLHASPKVQVVSLTAVFGNADVATTTQNAAYLADRFNIDVPTFEGADNPFARPRYVPELRVHGKDGYGDTNLAASYKTPDTKISAVEHIIETVKQHPHQITLLGLAPLTNFALALQKAPEIAELVAEVVIMGGAFGRKGRTGNIKPNAEANVFYDPEAADLVFAANWPVTVIGLDVTVDCMLPAKSTLGLAESGGDAGHFLWEISRGYEEVYKKFDGVDGCCIHDVAAAAYVTNPSWFKTKEHRIMVKLDGDDLGQTVVVDNNLSRPFHKIAETVESHKVISSYVDSIEALGKAFPNDLPSS